MDIRFLLILAVVAAIMEILGRLARRGAGTGAPRVPGPDGADPIMQQLEELQWVPGAHDDEDDAPAPRRERAALERPAAATATAPEPVREPEPLPTELPPATVPRQPRPVPVPRQPRPVPVPRQPRPVPVPRQPPPAQERVLVLRDRAPRPVPVRSREPGRVDVRPVEPRPVEREAPASAGGRLGLGTVDGLRRLVVAREVLGPPIALRDGERRT